MCIGDGGSKAQSGAVWGAPRPILSRNGAPSWGPRRPNQLSKKGPEGLERRLGSELDLTVYQIYVSVVFIRPDRQHITLNATKRCKTHRFYNTYTVSSRTRSNATRDLFEPQRMVHLDSFWHPSWVMLGPLGRLGAVLGRFWTLWKRT